MTKRVKPRVQFTKGRTTKLGVQAAWVYIFVRNEEAPREAKLTDDQIAQWMGDEFPTHRSKFFTEMRNGVTWRVQMARSRYNRGSMTGNKKPKVQSHRYDEDGNVNDPIYSGKAGVRLSRRRKRRAATIKKEPAPTSETNAGAGSDDVTDGPSTDQPLQ